MWDNSQKGSRGKDSFDKAWTIPLRIVENHINNGQMRASASTKK